MVSEALRAMTPTLREVAGRIGVSYGSIRGYATKARHPGPTVLHRLVSALRKQSRQLTRLADQLEREGERRTVR